MTKFNTGRRTRHWLKTFPAGGNKKRFAQNKENERIEESATVFKKILDMPEGIPKELLDKVACVVIYPSVTKAAFIVGGSFGRGVISCRSGEDLNGARNASAMFALEGGSVDSRLAGRPPTLSCWS
jgi:SH3 domain-containing YSC84-like protein 1